MNRSGIKKTALIASICALTLIGGAAAFLTSSDFADNLFTVAKVDLELKEKFDDEETLTAGQIITKEPWVKNTGTVNELFFVEVSVPYMNAAFLNSDGSRIVPDGTVPTKSSDYLQSLEIFNLLAKGEPSKGYIVEPNAQVNWEISYNQADADAAGWIYLPPDDPASLKHTYDGSTGMFAGDYNTYLLGYSTWVEPGHSTIPVFDQLQLRNIIDASIADGTIGQVQINAYTVQADALDLPGLTGDGSAAHPYQAADLAKIYRIVQNKQTTP